MDDERPNVELKLEGRYAGIEVVMDGDPSAGVVLALGSGEFARAFPAFLQMIVSWNVKDASGAPVPTTPEGIASVRSSLITAILQAYLAHFQQLPKAPGAG